MLASSAGSAASFFIKCWCDIVIVYTDTAIGSDGHDKPFCTTAITIIDDFKKALGDTDKR